MSDVAEATTADGFIVSSNTESTEKIRENLGADEAVSKAASELGKRGAEARAAKQEAKPAAEPANGEDPEGEPETSKETKPAKPRYSPQARIDQITKEKAEAQRDRDRVRAEADQAKAERDALKARLEAPPTPRSEEPAGKPTRAQFNGNDEAYIEALAEWTADQKLTQYKTQVEQAASVREYARGLDEHLGRAVAAREEYIKTDPAFLEKLDPEVIALANRPSFARQLDEPLGPDHVIADEIVLAYEDNPKAGAGLMLHFSQHPEEVQRLRALPHPQAIQVEMRILGRTLANAVPTATAPRGEVSRAKPPVRPVTGSPHTASSDVPDDTVSVEEHMRLMNARDRKERRSGR